MLRCDRCGGGGVLLGERWEACEKCPLCGGRGEFSLGQAAIMLREHESTLRGLTDPRHRTRRRVANRILTKIATKLNWKESA